MSSQILLGRSESIADSGFMSFGTSYIFTAGNEFQVQTPWAVAGTFRNFSFRVSTAPGAGKTRTFVVRKNGSDTGCMVTISDTALIASDTTHSFTVSPGDLLSLSCASTGTPTNPGQGGYSYGIEFVPDSTGFSGYVIPPMDLPSGAISTRWNGVFWPCPGSTVSWNSTTGEVDNIVACDGTITHARLYADVAPGVGTGYDIYIYKNGTKQDGTGGTVDTHMSITGTNQTASATFSLPVTAGDRVYTELTPSGAPSGPDLAIAFAFEADTEDEFMLGGWTGGGPTVDSTDPSYHAISYSSAGWSAIADLLKVQQTSGVVTFGLSDFRFRLDVAPGGSTTQTITVRRNDADTDLAILLTGSNLSGDDLIHGVALNQGDTVNLRTLASATDPASATWSSWSLVGVVAPETIRSHVFGSSATVTSTRTFFVNVDGVPRTVDDSGAAHVGGSLVLHEQTGDRAAYADAGRLYVVANGSGKLELRVIFPTGAVQTIATEP